MQSTHLIGVDQACEGHGAQVDYMALQGIIHASAAYLCMPLVGGLPEGGICQQELVNSLKAAPTGNLHARL